METIAKFLEQPLVTTGGTTVSVGQVIVVPILLLLFFLVAKWLNRLLVKRMTQAAVNPDLMHLIKRIYLIAVLAILVLTLLEWLNVPLTAFAFVSGAIAIGVGFGAQNIINNFISGWILLWERPIRINDFLEIGTTMGTVEAINTRSTRIKRVDGVHLLIPNSFLLENMVVNWTLVDRTTRTSVRVGVAYGSPVRRVEELMQQAAEENPHILTDPKPSVIFDSFGDNALEFEIFFWVMAGGERDLKGVRSDFRFRIEELFREDAIIVAFPQRDIHIDSPAPIDVRIIQPDGNANE